VVGLKHHTATCWSGMVLAQLLLKLQWKYQMTKKRANYITQQPAKLN